MKVKLLIDGKEKVFEQNTLTFKTIREAYAFQQKAVKEQELLMEIQIKEQALSLLTEPDDELADELAELRETFNEMNSAEQDMEDAVNLIVSFFNGQFTLDEFVNGCQFKNVAELYTMAQEIFSIAFEQKNDVEKKPNARGKKKV